MRYRRLPAHQVQSERVCGCFEPEQYAWIRARRGLCGMEGPGLPSLSLGSSQHLRGTCTPTSHCFQGTAAQGQGAMGSCRKLLRVLRPMQAAPGLPCIPEAHRHAAEKTAPGRGGAFLCQRGGGGGFCCSDSWRNGWSWLGLAHSLAGSCLPALDLGIHCQEAVWDEACTPGAGVTCCLMALPA